MTKDYRTHLDTLRKQAAECALINALRPQKRELFAKHAAELRPPPMLIDGGACWDPPLVC